MSLQSVSFAPNVTYSQIASPAVLLNHQQHHSHYSAHQQHGDQNKPMTMSAALSATASGNEMPGYPRVNSVPPRSLSCNGYPGLNEYGGNSINTTAQTQAVTNTSSVQASQMQPPQTSSRPNSSNQMYQMQSPGHQSSNIHMSPTPQAQSPSSHLSQHYQQSSGMLPATSQQDSQQDWNQSSWNDNRQRASDVFNQSDRINLNSRLKTMILNKNDKDQQQQQQATNHFLSYSHQHLSEQQQPLVNNQDLGKPSSNESKLTAGDVGGSDVDDSWKSSIMKHEQDNENTDYSKQNQQETNENKSGSNDSVVGKESEIVGKSNERETDLITIEPQFEMKNGAESLCDQEQLRSTPNASNQNLQKSEKPPGVEREKQSYSYHSAHEYQQHKNMVNNIKKEPSEETAAAGSVKYEGYEKNYQNFIRYADFCDAQQPQYDQKQTSYQQDYMQSQGYYNNYPYQNCAPPSQNYTQHSQTYQQFMTQQAAYQHGQHGHLQSSSLTNFEQQIPLHTYPIPKHGPGSGGETFQPTNIKIEPNLTNNLYSHPIMGDNSMMKDDNERFSRLNNNNNNMNVDNPVAPKLTRNEVNRIIS